MDIGTRMSRLAWELAGSVSLLCLKSEDGAVQAVNVTSQVKIVHKVHGVGHGGYDCNAGASNWMQGWPLD